MLGFRMSSPGPFWFEDVVYFILDEGRRLPQRTTLTARRLKRTAEAATARVSATLRGSGEAAIEVADQPALPVIREAELLDDDLTWSLATEPLATNGSNTALALHNAAAEQIGAVTYTLERLRAELAPMMTYASIRKDPVQQIDTEKALETSIDALLELSRKNAATRPKNRVRDAA